MRDKINDLLPLVSEEVRADLRRVAFAIQDTELFPWLINGSLACNYRFGFRMRTDPKRPVSDILKRKLIDLEYCSSQSIFFTSAALSYLTDHWATVEVLEKTGCLATPDQDNDNVSNSHSLVRLTVGSCNVTPMEDVVMSIISGKAFIKLVDRLGISVEHSNNSRPSLFHEADEDDEDDDESEDEDSDQSQSSDGEELAK